jgi:hypothetical protein
MILLLFVKSSMSLQFSSSFILQLVHIRSQILPSQKSLSSSFLLKFHHSFNKFHNFGGPCLPFLCAVWKFYRNPIKPRFICAMSSTSLTEVSKLLSSFYKAIFPMVNDLWASKLRKACVPSISSGILNDSTGFYRHD